MLAFNLGLLVYCLIIFSDKNFLYFNLDPVRSEMISEACTDLLRIHYFWLANAFNVFLFGLYYAFHNRINGAIIAGFGILIYLSGYFMFQSTILDNYYLIFRYQSVPEELISQPARYAGKPMGPLLIVDMTKVDEPNRQKNAIKALGAIKYNSVTDTLNIILNDWNTPNDVRFEAYFALKQMQSSKADSYLRIFMGAHHAVKDEVLLKKIKKFDY